MTRMVENTEPHIALINLTKVRHSYILDVDIGQSLHVVGDH